MFHLSALAASLAALVLVVPEAAHAENDAAVPPWFMQEIEYLTRAGGRWIADNSEYKGEEEPYSAYGIEWQKGLSRLTARGRLFAIDRDGNTHDLWELYLYWNPLDRRAVAMQVHRDGNFAVGELTAESDTETELVQVSWAPGGATFRFRHQETRSANEKQSRTFIKQETIWRPNRTYVWKRKIRKRQGWSLGVNNTAFGAAAQCGAPARTANISHCRADLTYYRHGGILQYVVRHRL